MAVRAASYISWELENYNDWNLPFAKTVEIKGQEGGRFSSKLAANTYKLEVDPSAFFSIIFLDKSEVTYEESSLVNLDYNAFGNHTLIENL